MIAKDIKRVCKDDISKIENYEQVKNDLIKVIEQYIKEQSDADNEREQHKD